MALFKFQNLNKHGNLRTRIVHSPTSQFSFNPSGYGKFVNVQRFYYEMNHPYLSASLYTDNNGDKFILPSMEKVHPETTLDDIKSIKPKVKVTRSKTIEQTFNSSSSDTIYNTKYYPDSGKYHCDCPGTWRTRGNCKHVKQMRNEIEG
jgi:hypothetical protein|tara:strand:+ start:743 stop:1186 length:444 start_codon:yes stop_codon:yes gene_type:complete